MSDKSKTGAAEDNNVEERREADNVIDFPRPAAPAIKCVTARELCSIKAMTAYVAHNQNVQEETVRAIVEAEFQVKTIEQIREEDYERVIAYLVNLRCDLLLN